jgi:hypothetical protein
VVVGVAVYVFRTLTAAGLTNDHFMHLAWAQQVALGDVPYRDFVEPGMPLMYLASAAVQWLQEGPFSEVILTSAMFGLAAAATYWLVSAFTGSLLLGLCGGIVEAFLQPRLYAYPKVLVPAAVLLALWRYADAPSRGLLWLMSITTVLGGLLRYDLGVFAMVTGLCGLLATPSISITARIRLAGTYLATTALVALPYVVFVQWAGGLWEQLRESMEFAKSDAHQFLLLTLDFPRLADWPLTDQSAAAMLYYAGMGLSVGAGALVLVARRRMARPQVVVLAGAGVCLACYSVWIVRHPSLYGCRTARHRWRSS